MDLKYWEKSEGRTPYDYEINSKFDPFDKTDENNLATKTGRKLNMSSILIKPKYGEFFTSQTLTAHLEKINEEMILIGPHSFPKHTPTVSAKNMILQFKNQEDAIQAGTILQEHKLKLLTGTFTHAIF